MDKFTIHVLTLLNSRKYDYKYKIHTKEKGVISNNATLI